MHLLATWELGRGYGHMGILANVSRALRARGSRVTFAARYPQAVLATCAADFDNVVAAPLYEGACDAAETFTYAQVIAGAGGLGSAWTLAPLVTRWLALIEQVKPDALLVEHAPASLLAARLAGVPAWRIGSSFVAPDTQDLGVSLLPWRDVPPAILAEQARSCDSAIRAVGGGFVDSLEELVRGTPRFVTTLRELDHFGEGAHPTSYHGDLGGLPDRPTHDDLQWPRAPGPKVLVYMPLDRGAGPALIEGLRQLRWPTIWHWPGATGSDAQGAVRFSPEPIDLAQAAGRTRIFIGRAGHGASAIMLRAGVAQLLVPDTLESRLLAYRLCTAGLATTRPGDAGASDYTRALVQLASGELDAALAQAKRKYARYDPRQAAKRIAMTIAKSGPRGAFRTYTLLGR